MDHMFYRTIKLGSQNHHCIPCRNGVEGGGGRRRAVNLYWPHPQFYKLAYATCEFLFYLCLYKVKVDVTICHMHDCTTETDHL